MSELKIEIGKFYRDNSGDKIEIVTQNSEGDFIGISRSTKYIDLMAVYDADGTGYEFKKAGCTEAVRGIKINSYTLLEEWKEPIQVEGWVNVYDPGLREMLAMHPTKEDADRAASPGRITCVYVKGTEEING